MLDPADSSENSTISVAGNVASGQTLVLTAFNNGATTVNWASSFTNDGTITFDQTAGGFGGTVGLDLPSGDTLTNAATATIAMSGPAGSTGNSTATSGTDTIDGSLTNQGTLNVGGNGLPQTYLALPAGTLTNTGTINVASAAQSTQDFMPSVLDVQAGATAINNAGGTIDNLGSITVEGAYTQDAGTIAVGAGDNPVELADGSTLDLAGSGAGGFAMLDPADSSENSTISVAGNVASGQTLVLTAFNNGATTVNWASSFTNDGTITFDQTAGGFGGTVGLDLPSGDTLTNAATATIAMSGPAGSTGNSTATSGTDTIDGSLTNQGTLNVGGSGLPRPIWPCPPGR